MTPQPTTIPAGYREDSLGRLVPEANIPELDKIRDDLDRQLLDDARAESQRLADFKRNASNQIHDFVALAAQEHGCNLGGKKGNITLTSFDGRLKVIRDVDEHIEFTQDLALARDLIRECIGEWSQGANPALVQLVSSAFETDRDGKLSVSKILSLRTYRIDEDKWRRAMDLISDSVRVSQSVHYLRFYERNAEGKFIPVPLDGSRLS